MLYLEKEIDSFLAMGLELLPTIRQRRVVEGEPWNSADSARIFDDVGLICG